MGDIPKRVKRLLREYASAAHEEELRRALLPLAEAFKRWEHGDLDSGELSDLIHRFHQGRRANSSCVTTPPTWWRPWPLRSPRASWIERRCPVNSWSTLPG